MIFRLSEKLKAKIKVGTLGAIPLHENPPADWSAHLFVVGRTQYILLSNTKSLYSTVMYGKGITDDSDFIDRALGGIRECLEAEGWAAAYKRFIAPASSSVRFAKALDRSVTGSMNDLVKHAAFWLAEGDLSPQEVGAQLNGIPMSALRSADSGYGFPQDVFAAMVGATGSRPNSRRQKHSPVDPSQEQD